jgi:O-antigen/teichoic acid export membrane protein
MNAASRLTLRAGSLAMKFALTMVVARMLGFDAVAAYGLAVAASVVASKVLGLGFSTELNRRLSGGNPGDAIRTAWKLFALHVAVYALLCVPLTMPGLTAGLLRVTALPNMSVWPVALVACAEHAALEVNTYLYSLHQTRAATWLLFVRTGAWAGVAIAALMFHMIGSIQALFAIWFAADIGVVAAGWMAIRRVARDLPAANVETMTPEGLGKVWKGGLPFFAALLLLSVLQYLERFVASGVLNAHELGRYVFVWSIANAIQTVAAATIVFAAAPRLVRAATGDAGDFRRELARSAGGSLVLSAAAALGVLALHGSIFRLADESGDTAQVSLLAVLLLSFTLRAVADVLWMAAVALRAGKAVAVVVAALALMCLPLTIALVYGGGALGAAFAHLVASAGIAGAIGWIVVLRMSPGMRKAGEAADAA